MERPPVSVWLNLENQLNAEAWLYNQTYCEEEQDELSTKQ